MGTFGPYPDPTSGNPDFIPGSTINSSEVDGNYDYLLQQLNGQNIADNNITPRGITGASISIGGILNENVSDADPTGVDLTIGVGPLKLQNSAVDDRVLADDAVEDRHVSDPGAGPYTPTSPGISGSKIQDGTIDFSKINFPIPSGPGNMQVGTVSFFAGATVPPQNVLCDGQELDKVAYAVLDGVLGGIYDAHPQLGAPAAGNFRVPDLLGRVPVGTGTQNNLGDNDTTAEAGRNAPSHTHAGTVDLPAIPDHTHPAGTLSGSKTNQSSGFTENIASYTEGPGHIIDPSGATKLVGGADGLVVGDFSPNSGGGGVEFTKKAHAHTFNITGIVIGGSTGSGGAYDPPSEALSINAAEMPYMALQPIIYTGV